MKPETEQSRSTVLGEQIQENRTTLDTEIKSVLSGIDTLTENLLQKLDLAINGGMGLGSDTLADIKQSVAELEIMRREVLVAQEILFKSI